MIIYYNDTNQFNLTEEEFKNALPAFEQGKNVWVERLQVHLTPFYKWAGAKPNNPNERALGGGLIAEKRFETWYAKGTDVKINLQAYPELLKDVDELPKQLN